MMVTTTAVGTEAGVLTAITGHGPTRPKEWFRRGEKKDVSTQVNTDNFSDRNEMLQTPVVDTNPFAKMSVNPYSKTDGLFPNPFFEDELMGDVKNPFLDKNEKLLLVNTGESWIPVLSSNPFFKDCLENGTISILNPADDPMKNVPQSPVHYKIHCKEWVEKHREYQVKKLRCFSI
ncbi:hypothetical protein AVEN_265854-1 [Araneus ventricosus]|uniref:Uncharacterized protein n=1 Tax=Araneus ventricosus TaxID=182803 RepID=A0A4Y2V875_ARAVE|nr:hypothetical protein AVEN_265854-1 [Araneus ventricosus]